MNKMLLKNPEPFKFLSMSPPPSATIIVILRGRGRCTRYLVIYKVIIDNGKYTSFRSLTAFYLFYNRYLFRNRCAFMGFFFKQKANSYSNRSNYMFINYQSISFPKEEMTLCPCSLTTQCTFSFSAKLEYFGEAPPLVTGSKQMHAL